MEDTGTTVVMSYDGGWQEPLHLPWDQWARTLTLGIEVASWNMWTTEAVDSSKSLNVKHLSCPLVLGSGQQDSEKHISKDTQQSREAALVKPQRQGHKHAGFWQEAAGDSGCVLKTQAFP